MNPNKKEQLDKVGFVLTKEDLVQLKKEGIDFTLVNRVTQALFEKSILLHKTNILTVIKAQQEVIYPYLKFIEEEPFGDNRLKQILMEFVLKESFSYFSNLLETLNVNCIKTLNDLAIKLEQIPDEKPIDEEGMKPYG